MEDDLGLVDVAVASFRKPESLIYTLLTLHKFSKERVSNVYINDDQSGGRSVELYESEALAKALLPWKINVRVNRKRMGWNRQGLTNRTQRNKLYKARSLKGTIKKIDAIWRLGIVDENDIRYQWAINQTDKRFILVTHDDVMYVGDAVGQLLETMHADSQCAIAGQLGQCWRCGHGKECSPNGILSGERPSIYWPLTPSRRRSFPANYERACRINEWCCMLRVSVARHFSEQGIYFGNYEDAGDIGAYWFGCAVQNGWHFADPFTSQPERETFSHGWQGHTGHSVWVDQGTGKRVYGDAEIREALQIEFGFCI